MLRPAPPRWVRCVLVVQLAVPAIVLASTAHVPRWGWRMFADGAPAAVVTARIGDDDHVVPVGLLLAHRRPDRTYGGDFARAVCRSNTAFAAATGTVDDRVGRWECG